MRRSFARLLVLVTVGLMASPAGATVLRRMTLDELSDRATLVVYATVTESFCHHARGDRGAIVTTTTLDVHHVVKGDAAQIPARGFRLTQVGGELDGLVARIPGQPRFGAGQRVVLFLQRVGDGWGVLGFGQGRFDVETEADGTAVAVRRMSGVAVVDTATGRADAGVQDDLRVPLSTLFQRVRAVAAGVEVTR